MSKFVDEFLKATGYKKFAQIDFTHHLNRKGVFVSDQAAFEMLLSSNLVEPTQDGMWRRSK